MLTAYTLLLMLSGLLLVVAGAAIGGQKIGARVLSIVIGLAFFGYGFYLEFLFQGDSYRVFFYAFVVPIVVIVRLVQSRKASRTPAAPAPMGQQGYPAPQGQPGYPAPQGQPGYPAPQGYAAPQGQPGYAAPQAQQGHQMPQNQPGYAAPQGQQGYPMPQDQPGYPAQQGHAPQAQPGYPAPRGQ